MRRLGTADLDLLVALFEPLTECPFFAKDESLHYVAANSAMARLCGMPRAADLLGKRALDIFPADLAKWYEALDRALLAGGAPLADRLELASGPEGAHWLLFSRLPVTDEEGKRVGVVGTSRRLSSLNRHTPVYGRLALVVEHIQSNYDAPLSLANLSHIAGISKSQLERDFTALFSIPLRSFLHRTRIDAAMTKLRGKDSVAQIALECGYSDHSAFSRRFKDTVGLTPRQFRERSGIRA